MGLKLRKSVWRGVWVIIGTTVVGCLYCAIRSVETMPFGVIVSAFVVPSVVLFILLEIVCSGPISKILRVFHPCNYNRRNLCL